MRLIPTISHKYRAWIRTQPCANPNCKGNGGDMIAAHQRCLGRGGTGIKPPDCDILPLCFDCHDLEHKGAVTFYGQGTKAKTKEYVQRLCDEYMERYFKGV